ncbi:hypothetical protein ACWGK6_26565 [Streptomyces violaceusniger]
MAERLLAGIDDALLLTLPGLAEVVVETVEGTRTLRRRQEGPYTVIEDTGEGSRQGSGEASRQGSGEGSRTRPRRTDPPRTRPRRTDRFVLRRPAQGRPPGAWGSLPHLPTRRRTSPPRGACPGSGGQQPSRAPHGAAAAGGAGAAAAIAATARARPRGPPGRA